MCREKHHWHDSELFPSSLQIKWFKMSVIFLKLFLFDKCSKVILTRKMYKDYIYSSQYRHKCSMATWCFQSQGTLNINAAASPTQWDLSAEPDGVILFYRVLRTFELGAFTEVYCHMHWNVICYVLETRLIQDFRPASSKTPLPQWLLFILQLNSTNVKLANIIHSNNRSEHMVMQI